VAGGAVGAHQRRALLLEQHSDLVGGGPPGDGLGHRGVALDGRLQRGCGHGPQTRVGQAGELEGGQRLAVGQLPGRVGRGGGDWSLAQPVEQLVDPRRHRAVAGQRAPVGAGSLAQPQELVVHPVGVGQAAGRHRLGAGGGRRSSWRVVGTGRSCQKLARSSALAKQRTGALAPAPPRRSQPTMSKRPWVRASRASPRSATRRHRARNH
jgi:hypothetical protein